MTPIEISKKENEITVFRNIFADIDIHPVKAKFSVGDKSECKRKRKIFWERLYSWIEEVFTVSEIKRTIPITYKIKDFKQLEIQGTFYEQELQKKNQEVFRIKKIVKKGKTKSLVKWKGCPNALNSWFDNKGLIKMYYK